MTKGLARSIARGPAKRAPIIKLTIAVKVLALTTTGASGVGFGTVVIGDLPEGNILFLGAVAYMKFTTADLDVLATFDGDYAIGTTATADTTLDGTDVNVTPSSPLGAATAGVSPTVRAVNATQAILDNTDGSMELNLNVLIDDASISGAGSFTVDGFLTIAYIVLNDD